MHRVVVVGAVILLFFGLVPRAAYADDWHSFHRDIKNTGVAESEGPPTNFVSWKVYLPTYGSGSPSYDNGVIFLPSGRFGLRAVNATTGDVLWTTPTSGNVYTTPTYHDGRIYFGAVWGNGTFYAANASDGSIVWTQIIGTVYTASPVVAGGVVFVTKSSYGTVALDVNNGSIIWNISSISGPGYMHSTPAYEDGVLYCGGNSLWALNAKNGSVIWKSPVGSSLSGIVIADDKVCGHDDDYVTCVNKTTGLLEWQSRTSTLHSWNAIESTPAVHGDRLFVGSQDGRAFAFSLQNGTELWNVTLGEWRNGSIISSPIVAPNDVVYFANDHLWALNATTGEEIWSLLVRLDQSYPLTTTPMLVNGILYYHDSLYFVAVGDLVPPEVSDITLNGEPTILATPGESVRIEALVSESQRGGHDVAGARFTTDPFFGGFQDFYPDDGAFDSPSERVHFDLDTTGMEDGMYGLEFRTCDSLNNCGTITTEVQLLIIDGTPPDIKDIIASPAEFILGGSTDITWHVSDLNGVKSSRIEILDSNGTVVLDELREGDGYCVATFDSVWHGEHSVRVTAIDSAGNVAEDMITFEVLIPQYPGDNVQDFPATWVAFSLGIAAIAGSLLLVIWRRKKRKSDQTRESGGEGDL